MSARQIFSIALGVALGILLVAALRSCSSSEPDVVRLESSRSSTSTTASSSTVAPTAPSSTSSPDTSTTAATLAPAPASSRPASTSLPARASRSAGSSSGPRSLGYFEATCYELRGATASGSPAGPGSIAVDPRVIPLGTKLRVEGYGDGVAADTGGAIKGRRIDVWKSSGCREWGRRSVLVEIRG